MDKPKEIRVLGKRHRIHWDQDLPDRYGDFDPLKLKLRIKSDLAADDEKETSLHEVIHAIELQMNVDLPEEAVRQLSVGLFSVLRNNPQYVLFLMEGTGDDE